MIDVSSCYRYCVSTCRTTQQKHFVKRENSKTAVGVVWFIRRQSQQHYRNKLSLGPGLWIFYRRNMATNGSRSNKTNWTAKKNENSHPLHCGANQKCLKFGCFKKERSDTELQEKRWESRSFLIAQPRRCSVESDPPGGPSARFF